MSEEKTNNSFVFNVQNANTVAQGYNVNQTVGSAKMNVEDDEQAIKPEDVLKVILETLNKEPPAPTPAPSAEQPAAAEYPMPEVPEAPVEPAPAPQEIAAEIEKLAAMPIHLQTTSDSQAQLAALVSQVKPWAPKIGKALLAFGKTALESFARSNPVVAGIVAACNSLDEAK